MAVGGLGQVGLDEVIGLAVYLLQQAIELLFERLEAQPLEQLVIAQQPRRLKQHHGLLVGLALEDVLIQEEFVLRCRIAFVHLEHSLQVLDILHGLALSELFGCGEFGSAHHVFGGEPALQFISDEAFGGTLLPERELLLGPCLQPGADLRLHELLHRLQTVDHRFLRHLSACLERLLAYGLGGGDETLACRLRALDGSLAQHFERAYA